MAKNHRNGRLLPCLILVRNTGLKNKNPCVRGEEVLSRLALL